VTLQERDAPLGRRKPEVSVDKWPKIGLEADAARRCSIHCLLLLQFADSGQVMQEDHIRIQKEEPSRGRFDLKSSRFILESTRSGRI
jgi:hypothetical protein